MKRWDALGAALAISFPVAVIIVNLMNGRIPYVTISVFSLVLLGWVTITLARQWRNDRRRLERSRQEANRLIAEYESTHGAGGSPWPEFK